MTGIKMNGKKEPQAKNEWTTFKLFGAGSMEVRYVPLVRSLGLRLDLSWPPLPFRLTYSPTPLLPCPPTSQLGPDPDDLFAFHFDNILSLLIYDLDK